MICSERIGQFARQCAQDTLQTTKEAEIDKESELMCVCVCMTKRGVSVRIDPLLYVKMKEDLINPLM